MDSPQFNGKRFAYSNSDRTPTMNDVVLVTPVLNKEIKLLGKVHEEWPWQVIETTQPVTMEDWRPKTLFRVDDCVIVEYIDPTQD
jgi:hypothetical protein